jgi:hypothetical protein
MKSAFPRILTLAAMALSFESALALGWTKGVTVTSITEANVTGEVVQVTVKEIIDNSAHCANPSGYALRDSATLKGSLALLMSSLVTEKPVDLFVTGTCDASGMPNVVGVTLH